MIKREDLKKGDHVLEIASSYSPRDINKISELVVVTIGPKYIGCQHIHDGETYGQVQKYNNDERMSMKDWGQWKELYHEIDNMLYAGLGYEKLVAIKTIIESDDLEKTLLELSPVKPACACG